MEKLDGKTLDLTKENINALKTLFPEVVTEGKIDFDKLKLVLGEEIETNKEKYEFTWHGKAQSLKLAQVPSTGTLRPDKESSKSWDTTENLYIEGDNLEVLKLLQKSYFGKVKMIYIDPPYNTGQDFVYKDDFKDNVSNYLEITKQKNKINPETNGRFHTDWLNMLYPRLKLAKNLLTEDGVIFISIDDNELENLIKTCDEIFSPDNYINTIAVRMKNIAGASGGGQDKRLKKNIEYVVCYAKDYSVFNSFNNVYDYTPLNELLQQYKDQGTSWKYTSVLVSEGEKKYVGSTIDGDGNEIKIYSRHEYVIKSINQIVKDEELSENEAYNKYATKIFQTQMPQSSIRPRVMEKVKELGINNDLYSIEYVPKTGRNKGKVYEQFYKGENFRLFAWLKDVTEEIDGILYKKDLQGTLWDFVGGTKNLTKEGGVPFPNGKKPLALIERLISMQTDSDSLILDFFSGSATTAHAVIKLNAQDEGKRKFIMVQLPESTDENSEEAKDGFKNICEIGKERIRRAGDKIVEETGKTNLDIGFKVFRLDSSNVKLWDPNIENLEDNLFELQENIKENRTKEDLLFEILLKIGIPLTTPIEDVNVNGKVIYNVGFGAVLLCLENEIELDIVHEIIRLKPEDFDCKVIFKETGFLNDSVKTNAIQTLKKNGITDVRSV